MCTWGFILKKSICKLVLLRPALFRPVAIATIELRRFSDSQLGAVSASWLHQEDGHPAEILHLQPNTYRGLSYISLAERIIGFVIVLCPIEL